MSGVTWKGVAVGVVLTVVAYKLVLPRVPALARYAPDL